MIEWIYPVGKPLVLETVAYLFRVERLFHFSCAKSKSIPCRIASARVISCLAQYSSRRFVASSSNRTFTSFLLGLFAFGSWRHRITSLFEFHKLIIIIGTQKVKRVFQFFSAHRRREQVFTCSLEDWTLAGASLPASLLPTTKRRVAYGNAFSTSKPVLILSKV